LKIEKIIYIGKVMLKKKYQLIGENIYMGRICLKNTKWGLPKNILVGICQNINHKKGSMG